MRTAMPMSSVILFGHGGRWFPTVSGRKPESRPVNITSRGSGWNVEHFPPQRTWLNGVLLTRSTLLEGWREMMCAIHGDFHLNVSPQPTLRPGSPDPGDCFTGGCSCSKQRTESEDEAGGPTSGGRWCQTLS